jgi:DNA polymerase III delta subunit
MAPHPEDELARLHKLAAHGLPAFVLVTGTSDHFRAEAMERLLAAVPKDAELRVLDAVDERAGPAKEEAEGEGDAGDETPDGDPPPGDGAAAALAACPELQDLRGGGLFARRAFLFVRRAAGFWAKHIDAIATTMPRFGKGCGLVLEAPKVDRRKKVAQQLVKATTEAGAAFEFRDLYEQPFERSRGPLDGELCKWVMARAQKRGVALQADAAWLVVMQVGKNLAELLAELDRLRDRVGADPKRRPLAPADLRGQLTCSFQSTPFEFAEAVLRGDRRAAYRSLRAIFDRGVRGKDGQPMKPGGLFPFATSWLFQQLAMAYEGRLSLDGGMSPRDVAQKAGVYQFVERFVEQLQKNDRTRLRRGLLALHACQRSLRITGEEPDTLLERFLAQWFDGAPIPTMQDLAP